MFSEAELLAEAKKNAGAAATLWRWIAAGEVSTELALKWVKYIAPRVVEVINSKDQAKSIENQTGKRPEREALKAICLAGHVDKHLELKMWVKLMDATGRSAFTNRQLAKAAKVFDIEGDLDQIKRVIDQHRAPRKTSRKINTK